MSALPLRRVTMRDLVHRGADLLDDVECDGVSLIVTRSGRPVAILTPLPRRALSRRSVRRIPARSIVRSESLGGEVEAALNLKLPDLSLTRLDREILTVCADRRGHPIMAGFFEASAGTYQALVESLGKLEMAGLILKRRVGYAITATGARMADVVKEGAQSGAGEDVVDGE